MGLSTHYYVISLGRRTNALFEAFRDTLIDIQNHGFPVQEPTPAANPGASAADRDDSADPEGRVRELLQLVDERFGYYYQQEPLAVVVAGEKELRSAFTSMTAHREAIVGHVEGDFTQTSLHDLGKIVWPVVREAMSGSREQAMRDLETTADARKICGLEAVGQHVNDATSATLLVEEDYHVRGHISKADGRVVVSPNVDVRDEIDDVIDALIDTVLAAGGNVVFMPDGFLRKMDRIVLLLSEVESVR